ncbi:6186_t:CDS:2 [Paraglomus brasilianum]|uniref:6186_t:CDS:1 n=1 Tax=Paraglomus brasilianum TaxID=144538 RepID=A0A9N9B9F6_9GLOM|nr:6186_t:CDS:2 [Paraglomus brasilianum]
MTMFVEGHWKVTLDKEQRFYPHPHQYKSENGLVIPHQQRKLQQILSGRENPEWIKQLKSEWRRLAAQPINNAYITDSNPETLDDLVKDPNALYDELIESTTKALNLLQEQKTAGNLHWIRGVTENVIMTLLALEQQQQGYMELPKKQMLHFDQWQNRGGSDGKNQPWPNLIVEFAYAESEANVKDKVEKYWLMDGRAHDAIVIKIEPITSVTTPPATPTCMTAWNYCTNNVTVVGVLNPTMYEFGSVDRPGNPINPQLGQNVINIQLECLYHGVPNVVIPSLPLPNPIPINLFYVRFAIEHCIVR